MSSSKRRISNYLIFFFLRLTFFRNPDFYKSQAMRLPIYDKPRVIDCGEETDDYLILPRGYLMIVCELLDELGFIVASISMVALESRPTMEAIRKPPFRMKLSVTCSHRLH